MRCLPILLTTASLLAAQANAGEFDFTPFTGYRFGATLLDAQPSDDDLDIQAAKNWGFIIGRNANQQARYELLYSHQGSVLTDRTDPGNAFDLEIHYLQLGGTLDVGHDTWTPFVSGGVGMSYIKPDGVRQNNETNLSLSLGGGVKWSPSPHLGLRLEIRGYGTLAEDGSGLFCASGCELQARGDLLPQYETNLGLTFHF